MLKNPTPQQIAGYATLLSVGALLLVTAGLLMAGVDPNSALFFAVVAILGLVVVYNINIFYLRKYIYRKIKLIYKTIHQEKVAPEEKNKTVDVNSNIIEDVPSPRIIIRKFTPSTTSPNRSFARLSGTCAAIMRP